MNKKDKLLLNLSNSLNIENRLYWKDAIRWAIDCVEYDYPMFNSNSTVPVTCPTCGEEREVIVKCLYNGHGYECRKCQSSKIILVAQHNSTNSELTKIAQRRNAAIASKCHTSEE